jgi:hypothetical protein
MVTALLVGVFAVLFAEAQASAVPRAQRIEVEVDVRVVHGADARRAGKLAGHATVQPDWSIVARRIREEATYGCRW